MSEHGPEDDDGLKDVIQALTKVGVPVDEIMQRLGRACPNTADAQSDQSPRGGGNLAVRLTSDYPI